MVTTPGVIKIVGFNSQAARIESHEIEQLRLLASGSLKIEPLAYLNPGALVRIKDGPLDGTWAPSSRTGRGRCWFSPSRRSIGRSQYASILVG